MIADAQGSSEREVVVTDGIAFLCGVSRYHEKYDIHQDKGDNNKREADCAATNEIVNVYHTVVFLCQLRQLRQV